jgi:hypothetical protein
MTGGGVIKDKNSNEIVIKPELKFIDFTPLMNIKADSTYNNRLKHGFKFNKRMNISSNSPNSNYMKSFIDLSFPNEI